MILISGYIIQLLCKIMFLKTTAIQNHVSIQIVIHNYNFNINCNLES